MMELIYKNVALGKIVVTNRETFWVSGDFYPYPEASEFQDFFDALLCEDGFDEAGFDEDLLKEDHWFVSEMGVPEESRVRQYMKIVKLHFDTDKIHLKQSGGFPFNRYGMFRWPVHHLPKVHDCR